MIKKDLRVKNLSFKEQNNLIKKAVKTRMKEMEQDLNLLKQFAAKKKANGKHQFMNRRLDSGSDF